MKLIRSLLLTIVGATVIWCLVKIAGQPAMVSHVASGAWGLYLGLGPGAND